MRITIKKWGNSAGMVIPGALMDELGVKIGQSMEAEVIDNQLIMKPARKKYTLDELLAHGDPSAPKFSEEDIWGKDNPVGKEVW
ncbi:AbrB/MazE/SpoVT family DNA-binding domain-containing protein [Cedecea sp. P7760]|jgi:antitoxin ChpS|uniref:AbrB/MazE/SpoVT family DNA-binding domain-containing protein n=1 Tax=Cedecea sp. P7760 TaxID=2726983 RepID=UPI0015A3AA5C|nr:AbrB/MazE/SpoVT family DNA-binding domain-containing protein [Cedecea sp. P7760]NWC64341.1 AbrB/MazE/SpoVT family DNA-binding domain-containing protein [Cedecea sp. P7760]